jgi:hypothetical protein
MFASKLPGQLFQVRASGIRAFRADHSPSAEREPDFQRRSFKWSNTTALPGGEPLVLTSVAQNRREESHARHPKAKPDPRRPHRLVGQPTARTGCRSRRRRCRPTAPTHAPSPGPFPADLAPWALSVSQDTPARATLRLVCMATMPRRNSLIDPGTSVSRSAIRPPVHDSATASFRPRSRSSPPIRLSSDSPLSSMSDNLRDDTRHRRC